jgi:hypothetical protein
MTEIKSERTGYSNFILIHIRDPAWHGFIFKSIRIPIYSHLSVKSEFSNTKNVSFISLNINKILRITSTPINPIFQKNGKRELWTQMLLSYTSTVSHSHTIFEHWVLRIGDHDMTMTHSRYRTQSSENRTRNGYDNKSEVWNGECVDISRLIFLREERKGLSIRPYTDYGGGKGIRVE